MKPIQDMSIEEAKQEAARRDDLRARGLPLTPTPEQLAVDVAKHNAEVDARLEKQIQATIVRLYREFGCKVYILSQARASKQTPGLPDLLIFYRVVAWWHEVKTPTGKQSADQRDFMANCKNTGVYYVLGGVRAAEDWLIELAIAARAPDGTLERSTMKPSTS